MAEVVKRNKALSVSPLKSSQPVGAALAFLGVYRALPMLHGSQGCTAFGKVLLVRHFREPIPLQTTALDQVSTIMNPDENLIEGLRVVAEKSQPALVGVVSTGLSETQGTDLKRAVSEFRARHPDHAQMAVVPVNAPDYKGCLESGFALAVQAMLETLVPAAATAGTAPGQRKRQVNVLAGSALTPGDLEVIKDALEAFGLRPVVVPDLGDALDGHLTGAEFSPLSVGGVALDEFAALGLAQATLVVGASLYKAADLLKARTGVEDYRFDSLMGLAAFDRLLLTLQEISGQAVPPRFERQRSQLQDAMLDTHFMLGQLRVAVAADPDELYGFSHLLADMGAAVVAAVAPAAAEVLERVAAAQVKLGDLQDLESLARSEGAQLLIGNSHAVASAERLGLPILRAGIPQYDYLGGYQRGWVGYRATRQALFDLANLVVHGPDAHGIAPYRSRYAQKPEFAQENDHAIAQTPAGLHHGHGATHAA